MSLIYWDIARFSICTMLESFPDDAHFSGLFLQSFHDLGGICPSLWFF